MAFIASAFSSMSKDMSKVQRPKTVYNRATGEHEKPAAQRNAMEWWTGDKKLPLEKMRRKYNPTDAKVREHLRQSGA